MSPTGSLPVARDDGFTLLELMVVMALMALLATTAFPMLKGQFGRAAMMQESRDIAAVFAGARRHARLSGETVVATLDLQARTVAAPGGALARWDEASSLQIEAAAGLMTDQIVEWVFFHDGTATGGDVTIRRADLDPVVVKVDWLTGVSLHGG